MLLLGHSNQFRRQLVAKFVSPISSAFLFKFTLARHQGDKIVVLPSKRAIAHYECWLTIFVLLRENSPLSGSTIIKAALSIRTLGAEWCGLFAVFSAPLAHSLCRIKTI